MSGQESRTAVVTGASAGIGKATAVALARMGWHVIGVGRDPARSAAAEAEIRAAAAPGAKVDFVRADFTLMSDVRRAANEITALTSRIDALINNAGGVRDRLVVTPEGNEATFAANHLAPFLLTRELMPVLKATARSNPPGSRARHRGVVIRPRILSPHELGRPEHARPFHDRRGLLPGQAREHPVHARAHPARRGGRHRRPVHASRCDRQQFRRPCRRGHAQPHAEAGRRSRPSMPPERSSSSRPSPEAGRDGGRYFHDCKEVAPAPQALDDEAARRLWEESEKLLAKLGC